MQIRVTTTTQDQFRGSLSSVTVEKDLPESEFNLKTSIKEATQIIKTILDQSNHLGHTSTLAENQITSIGLCSQFVIKSDTSNETYILAGISSKKLSTVNSSEITDPGTVIFAQLADTLNKGTFGVFKLVETNGGVQLVCSHPSKSYPITIDRAHINNNCESKNRAVNLSFDCTVTGMTVDELQSIATRLTNTASFWHQFYNALSKLKPPSDINPNLFYSLKETERQEAIETLTRLCVDSYTTNSLLLEPKDLFKKTTNRAAIEQCFDSIKTRNVYINILNNKVSVYGQRSAYHLVNINTLTQCIEKYTKITDIKGVDLGRNIVDQTHVEESLRIKNPKLNLENSIFTKRTETNQIDDYLNPNAYLSK